MPTAPALSLTTPRRAPLETLLEGLDARERSFVREYPADFNATNAALRAKYGNGNAASAKVQGVRLMGDPRIVEAIIATLESRAERANIEAGALLEELSAIAFSNLDHYVIDDHGNVALAPGAPTKAIRAVSKIKKKIRHIINKDEDTPNEVVYETEISLWNKNEAINMAMKHRGMFIERSISVTATLEEYLKTIQASDGDR